MLVEQAKQDLFFELEAWQNIIHSEDWRTFLKLLKNHQEYLQNRVNQYVEAHEDRKAGEELAKLLDCEKIVNLVSYRISELRKQSDIK